MLRTYSVQATYDGNIVERGSDSPGYAFTPDAYNKTLGWAVADHDYFRLSDGSDTDYNAFYDSTKGNSMIYIMPINHLFKNGITPISTSTEQGIIMKKPLQGMQL